jgi:hypothetical protein
MVGGAMSTSKTKAAFEAVIAAELASIGAIDAAMGREREPGYVILLRSAKMAKQANVEQLLAMSRLAGRPARAVPSKLEPLLKMQSASLVRLGTTPLLGVMLLVERTIAARYEALLGTLEGAAARGLQTCWRRARKHVVILTAHMAVRTANAGLVDASLPRPLGRYFAGDEARVCFRCLFDRPGREPALERRDPHPYTYVCAACHEEVLADLPADLLDSAGRWPERERQNLVIERALGRVSKLKAETKVLNELSGLAPDLPPPPLPRKNAVDMAPVRRAKERPAATVVPLADAAAEERAYTERLFDPGSVQESW